MKNRKWTFHNRWKQTSAYRIEFFPILTVVKNRKYKIIGIELFGFSISLQKNIINSKTSKK